MKTILLISLLALSAGCATAPVAHQPIDAKPAIAAQEGKDAAIVSATARIDAIVDQWLAQFPSPLGAQIKAETAEQRAEVKRNPASNFNVIVDAYKTNAALDAKTVSRLTKERDSALDYVDRVLRIGLTGLGAVIMAASVGAFFMLAQLVTIFPNLGPRIIGGIAGIGATLFASGIAYSWASNHPKTVGCALAVCALAALFYWHANRIYAKS